MSSSTSLADRSRRSRIAKSRSRSRAAIAASSKSVADDASASTLESTLIPLTPIINVTPDRHNTLPARVTPTRNDVIPWKDSSVPPEVVLDHGASSNTIVSQVPVVDDDMPMDEMIHAMKKRTVDSPMLSALPEHKTLARDLVPMNLGFVGRQNDSQRSNFGKPKLIVDAADRGGGGRSAIVDDDMSSLGIEETSLARLTLAIKSKSGKRPGDLNTEEKALWDVVQSTLITQTSEQLQKRRILEQQVQETSRRLTECRTHNQTLQKELESTSSEVNNLKRHLKIAKEAEVDQARNQQFGDSKKVKRLESKLAGMETKYKEVQVMMENQQDEHDSAVRAIQRVMAELSSQKEAEMLELQQELTKLKSERHNLMQTKSPNGATVKDGAVDLASLRASAERAVQLERELENTKLLLETVEDERDVFKLDLDQKGAQLVTLARELSNLKDVVVEMETRNVELEATLAAQSSGTKSLEMELATAKKALESLTQLEKRLTAENDAKDRQIVKLKRHYRSGSPSEFDDVVTSRSIASHDGNVEADAVISIRKQLEEKEKSLETSKMLIASLQDANGSMAVELRAKLKEKEEHLHAVEAEAYERKKTCDSLAVELRDLQIVKSKLDKLEGKTKMDAMKHKALAKKLQVAVSELQSVSAVHEATTSCNNGIQDEDIVDKVGAVLCNTLMALKMSLAGMEEETTERYDGDTFVTTGDVDVLSVSSVGGVDPQELHRQVDAIIRHDREAAARDLRCELEEKSSAIQKLDELLRQERDEVARLKMQNASLKAEQEEAKAKHCTEIVTLKGQCLTNMEVLTKKERELEVLRDSLVVSDCAGYISDESDDDDEDTSINHRTTPLSYGATEPEAFTFARTRDGSETDVNGDEIQRIQFELTKAQREKDRAGKELRSERESLANAKMIISSLEKANKTMLEDLRSRLQDSNAAIESLLDKSTENEKTTALLKLELEKLKKEKDKAKADYSAISRKLKDDALVAAMREAAKEREIAQLRLAVAAASPLPQTKRRLAEP
jgi:hypothetical protein